jgi:hypothetical protein
MRAAVESDDVAVFDEQGREAAASRLFQQLNRSR